jgi:hypothetical protein
MNYDMTGIYMPLNELHSILSMAETSIRRVPDVLAVTKYSKKVMKGKKKEKGKAKGKDKIQLGSNNTPKPLKVSMPTLNNCVLSM